MSLYQKYRPKNFTEVVGQDHIVTTLENAVLQGKIAHAYLFSGPRGTGKTSIARILAKMLLTRGIEDETIQKQIIKAVEEESLVDLLEIDAASNTGVDNIRDLLEKIQFTPVVSAAKVYIIDEVHMLSKGAFSALLKTLEEPPEYAYFILATTELQKVPATIQSRCQRFPFRHVREEDIIRHLQYIADQERIPADRTALRAIARHAQGGMRDAISLLDQLRGLEKITAEEIRARVGESGQEHVDAVLAAIETGDKVAILETVRKVEDAGIALDTLLRQLLTTMRESLHSAVLEGKDSAHLRTMLEVLLTAIRDVRAAPVPGLVLESALLSLAEPDADGKGAKTERGFLKRKKDAEPPKEKVEAKAAPIETAALAVEVKRSEAIVEAPEVSLESLRSSWPNIVNSITPPSVKMSLKNGRVYEVKEKTVTLSFSSAFHRDKVAETQASRNLEEILERIFKRRLKLECKVEEETHAEPEGANKDMVNLAEAAAEIF